MLLLKARLSLISRLAVISVLSVSLSLLSGCRSATPDAGSTLVAPPGSAGGSDTAGPVSRAVEDAGRPGLGSEIVGIPVPSVVREGEVTVSEPRVPAPANLVLGQRPTPARPGPRPFSAPASIGAPAVDATRDAAEAADAGASLKSGALMAETSAKALDASIDSTDFDDNITTNSMVFIPPDPHAAVGQDHLVNVVNTTIRFHQRDGALDYQGSLESFFSAVTPANATFDPKVLYDQFDDRFVVVTLEKTDTADGDPADTSRILLAVSDDGDPNGTWYVTSINSKVNYGGVDTWADYPGFALDEKAVYISTNQFAFAGGGGGFEDARQWIVEKDAAAGFYAGGTAEVDWIEIFTAVGYSNLAGTTQPAHIFGSSPFSSGAGTFFTSYSGLNAGGNEAVQAISVEVVSFASSGSFTVTNNFVFLGDIDIGASFPNAPQLGSATTIATNNKRALNAVWRDSTLWVATTINPVASSPDTGEATAYWIELDTTSVAAISLVDQGAIGGEDIATDTFTFFPSIAVNSDGDVGIGFSASASTMYAGSYYTWRQAGDAAGTTRSPELLRAGTDYYIWTFGSGQNRWGDYTATVVDPVSGCFWTYNQHAMTRGTPTGPPTEDGRWDTAYGLYCPCSETTSLTASQWKQISLPCDVGGFDTVESAFGDDLGTAGHGTDWAVVERDAGNQQYVQLGLTDTLVEGRGYWIKTLSSGQSVKVEGSRNQVMDTSLVSDTTGRVNLVGHPFDYNVCWADVKVWDGGSERSLGQADPVVGVDRACDTADPIGNGCLMSREAYLWNGSAYQVIDGETPTMEGTLTPFDGVWVKAFSSGISLRVPEQAGCSSKRPVRNPGGGLVRLTASSAGLSDPGNLLGRYVGSVDGHDRHDLVELEPFEAPYLTIVFPHLDWGDHASGWYTTDLRAAPSGAGGTWSLEVRTDVARTITLTWAAADSGGADLIARSSLLDVETGDVMDDLSVGSWTIDVLPGGHRLEWRVEAAPLAGLIFMDGLESGGASLWSAVSRGSTASRD